LVCERLTPPNLNVEKYILFGRRFFVVQRRVTDVKIIAKNSLRELRMKRGFSIETFAKVAGIAYVTACHVENGTTAYPMTTKKICAALKCEFDEIFNIIQ